jgi:hypothetical protein
LNLKELEHLVKDGESDRLEFKKLTGQRTQAAKTVWPIFQTIDNTGDTLSRSCVEENPFSWTMCPLPVVSSPVKRNIEYPGLVHRKW